MPQQLADAIAGRNLTVQSLNNGNLGMELGGTVSPYDAAKFITFTTGSGDSNYVAQAPATDGFFDWPAGEWRTIGLRLQGAGSFNNGSSYWQLALTNPAAPFNAGNTDWQLTITRGGSTSWTLSMSNLGTTWASFIVPIANMPGSGAAELLLHMTARRTNSQALGCQIWMNGLSMGTTTCASGCQTTTTPANRAIMLKHAGGFTAGGGFVAPEPWSHLAMWKNRQWSDADALAAWNALSGLP